jgi:hypothetical protein
MSADQRRTLPIPDADSSLQCCFLATPVLRLFLPTFYLRVHLPVRFLAPAIEFIRIPGIAKSFPFGGPFQMTLS